MHMRGVDRLLLLLIFLVNLSRRLRQCNMAWKSVPSLLNYSLGC